MGIFQGMSKVKVGRTKGEYIVPGRYLCRVDRTVQDKKQDGTDFCVIEMTVIKVIEDGVDKDGKPCANRKGQAVGWFTQKQGNQCFARDIKQAVTSLFGEVPTDGKTDEQVDKEWDDLCTMMFNEPVLNGRVIEVKCRHLKSVVKKDGKTTKPFDKTDFIRQVPIPEVLRDLSPEDKSRYFPNGVLESLHKADEEAEAGA